MLGNLFSQRKLDDPSAQPATPVPSGPAASVTPPPSQAPVIGSSMDPTKRQDLSVMTHLDTRTTQVIAQAEKEAKRLKQALIEPLQLLYGLTFDGEVFGLLSQFSVDSAKLAQEILQKEQEGTFTGQPTLSADAKKIIEGAFSGAKKRGANFVTPEDVLVSLCTAGQDAYALLQSQGLDKAKLEEKLMKSAEFRTGKKSVLDEFGIDLTDQAKQGKLDPIAGREKEIDRLTHILLRRTKNNPIIIGEAGVGKTAIVEGVAQFIVNGAAPKELQGKRIIQLDVSSLVAGASHRGEFEERLKNVIQETMVDGTVILFVDEIHTLVGAGDNDGALNASNIIKPYLARGQLQVIGTTTTAEYRKYFEKDKAFERRFQPVIAEEPSEEVAVQMMQVVKPKYEKFHNVVIPDEALVAAVHLSKKYIGERYLPDKGVDLLDEACAQVKLSVGSGKRTDTTVTKSDIEQVVSSWTGIPITKLTEDESEKLLHIDDLIHKRLIDQQEAVVAVAEAVRRGRIGLASPNRPIASFIFLGPTGVGKTELAKTLAEILFGRDDAMVRLDMSEYMEKHEVAKLIGAPPGYVGYEEGGQLTEAVRAKPYSIVLLDEVEKAHPDVFNILLQLLEDGRLTDNKGNTISFKNTIVICTSNIGSAMIQQKLIGDVNATPAPGTPPADPAKTFVEVKDAVVGELRKFFRPELLNRFDEVVVFKPLAQADMTKIAKLSIDKTAKLLKDQNISLQIAENALNQLAIEGYDPLYGARPLRRLIQTAVENPIALEIIKKTFGAGDTVIIDYDTTKQNYTFAKATTAASGQAPQSNGQPQDQTANPAQTEQPAAGGMGSTSLPPIEQPGQPDLGAPTQVPSALDQVQQVIDTAASGPQTSPPPAGEGATVDGSSQSTSA